MVDALEEAGVVTSEAVGRALRDVPRHCFLPAEDVVTAYADRAVVFKRSPDGQPLSSASQPTMVAAMLELLDVRRGQRVLEVGTGTGYNAALLSTLVGPDGSVVTVELEEDLAERAARVLAATGAGPVEVVCGDGGAGHAPGAPYDRIIVTVGAPDLERAWTEQLVDGGRVVAPVVGGDGIGSVVVVDKVGGALERRSEVPCGFLLMRGTSSTRPTTC
jgi:protein-L-isoaspartate(D-aspartate) O-methyltransferase